MRKYLKWHSKERADLADMIWSGLLGLFENILARRTAWLPAGRTTGSAATGSRIFTGWTLTPTNLGVDTTAVLARGSGIFSITEQGQTEHGILVAEAGQSSVTLDFASVGVGSWAVWIRALYQDSDRENRVFWDATGATEYVEHQPTRRELTWEYAITAWTGVPTGNNWVKIWKVTAGGGGVVTAVDDYRHFFFEGDVKGAYAAEWGSGNDRNANRALYGVTDLHKWVHAVRQKIRDIQGSAYAWYVAPDPDLTDMAVEHKTTGLHSAVHADTVEADTITATVLADSPGVSVIPTASDVGLLLDAETESLPSTGNGLGRVIDPEGERPVLFEAYGRIARGHLFSDDFCYRGWSDVATIPPQYDYTRAIGAEQVLSSASGGGSPCNAGSHGGALICRTGAVAGDSITLLGPRCLYLDTAQDLLWRLFLRLAIDGNGAASRSDSVGLFGSTWKITVDYNQVAYGNDHWWLYVDDGVNPPVTSDSGVSAVADTFVNASVIAVDATHVLFWVQGMVAPALVVVPTMAAAGDVLHLIAGTANNGVATAHDLLVDLWELWDCDAIAHTGGRNPV